MKMELSETEWNHGEAKRECVCVICFDLVCVALTCSDFPEIEKTDV